MYETSLWQAQQLGIKMVLPQVTSHQLHTMSYSFAHDDYDDIRLRIVQTSSFITFPFLSLHLNYPSTTIICFSIPRPIPSTPSLSSALQ